MSSSVFSGDVLLKATDNGGDIVIEDGLVVDCTDFSSAAYLSLFGGNEDDEVGREKETWWGNLVPGTLKSEKHVSAFQSIIRGCPLTAINLRKAQEAAVSDLNWFIDEKIADEIAVSIRAEGVKQVVLSVVIKKDEKAIFSCGYSFQWQGAISGIRQYND